MHGERVKNLLTYLYTTLKRLTFSIFLQRECCYSYTIVVTLSTLIIIYKQQKQLFLF